MARFSRGFDQSYTADDAAPQPRPQASTSRANKYAGRCRQCSAWVEAEQGLLVGSRTEGWGVEHEDCTVVETVERAPQPVAPVGKQTRPLVPGWYTVVFDDDDDYRTIRIELQDEDADFMPGRLILAYLSGHDNESDYTRFAHVDERGYVRVWKKHQDKPFLARAIKVLTGDPESAAKSYALKSQRCYRCDRRLTTPASIQTGIGPDCLAKYGY